MTYFITTFFSEKLFANQDLLHNANIGLRLFREAPEFAVGDSRYTSIETTDELLLQPGWVETTGTGYPLTNTITVTRRRVPDVPPQRPSAGIPGGQARPGAQAKQPGRADHP